MSCNLKKIPEENPKNFRLPQNLNPCLPETIDGDAKQVSKGHGFQSYYSLIFSSQLFLQLSQLQFIL